MLRIKIMAAWAGMLRHLGSLCALHITSVLPSAFRRRFEPFATGSIPGNIHIISICRFTTNKNYGSPNGNRTRVTGMRIRCPDR